MTRLQIYDQLRKMHALLKDIPIRNDEWENCVIDAVDRVLYLAESEFARILPVPVLAEPSKPSSGEARESTKKHAWRAETSNGLRRVETTGDSRGGQNPFDKRAYQKEYMRKRRAKDK